MRTSTTRGAAGGSVTRAVKAKNWPQARYELALQLARAADKTESARDLKALSLSLAPLLDRCELDQRAQVAASDDSPLAQILAEAERQERELKAI